MSLWKKLPLQQRMLILHLNIQRGSYIWKFACLVNVQISNLHFIYIEKPQHFYLYLNYFIYAKLSLSISRYFVSYNITFLSPKRKVLIFSIDIFLSSSCTYFQKFRKHNLSCKNIHCINSLHTNQLDVRWFRSRLALHKYLLGQYLLRGWGKHEGQGQMFAK